MLCSPWQQAQGPTRQPAAVRCLRLQASIARGSSTGRSCRNQKQAPCAVSRAHREKLCMLRLHQRPDGAIVKAGQAQDLDLVQGTGRGLSLAVIGLPPQQPQHAHGQGGG